MNYRLSWLFWLTRFIWKVFSWGPSGNCSLNLYGAVVISSPIWAGCPRLPTQPCLTIHPGCLLGALLGLLPECPHMAPPSDYSFSQRNIWVECQRALGVSIPNDPKKDSSLAKNLWNEVLEFATFNWSKSESQDQLDSSGKYYVMEGYK